MTSETIEVNGLRTHLLKGGDGPALVYLHGAAPAGEWLPIHERLAEHFTVYAPDHPGFGDTDRPEWLEGMDDVVLHYDELLQALGLERPAVAGFSLGGWIGAEIAVTYRERLGALVLLNAAGLHVEGHLIPDLLGISNETLVQALFHDPAFGREWFLKRESPLERLRRYRNMVTLAQLAWNPWFDPKLERRLRRITCPTLVLWADNDRLVSPAYAEAYHRGIPASELQLLPHAGHMVPIEQPEAVADAITEFLKAR